MADRVSPDFSIYHRDYQRFANRWTQAYDFFRGGIHVLQPDHDVQTVSFLKRSESDADGTSGGLSPESGLQLSDFDEYTVPSRSFLWKHERETSNEYADRSRRQINWPVFQKLVNTFVSGILRVDPLVGKDGAELSDPWRGYVENVDLAGTPMVAFRRMALSWAICFGRVHAITDRPAGLTAISRAEQEARGERAYSYLVSPLDLVDWALDHFGRFVWAVVREPAPDDRGPGMEQADFSWQYRVWTTTGWSLWRGAAREAGTPDTGPKFVLVGSGDHGLGKVPIQTLWAVKEGQARSMAVESPLADFMDLNRHILNKSSELDCTERAQAFDQLAVPGEGAGSLEIGRFRAFTFNAESGGRPEFLSPNPQHAKGAWDRIQEQMNTMRALASTGRGKAESSKEERSGESIVLESADQQNQMASWASAGNEWENGLYQDVALWEAAADPPRASWARKFDVRGLGAQISEVERLATVPGVTKEASAAMAIPLVDKKLQEHGAPFAERMEIAKGIRAEGQKVDPPPVVMAPPGAAPDEDDEDDDDAPSA